ncbi:MAG: hypothetical protein Edafosvirus27_6 [Edafosvirus sp.]|uniref:Uncharacterized protein n=1 Tax=Edafosvirus sp. TaxID=2487765 RepID=A0A3G4ZUX5_9VIRU|nr:MAG: hypothetical protein Edafosvirus27_6 [Edafosvirus sp.]
MLKVFIKSYFLIKLNYKLFIYRILKSIYYILWLNYTNHL